MRVFVAGATGVIGRQLVARLVAAGHEVVGMTRSASKSELLRTLGARPVIADALDPEAVLDAVVAAEPQVVVNELTALTGVLNIRNPDRALEMTNRLRTEGTDSLLKAARSVGVRRIVAQSFAGWPYARTGGPVKSETDMLDSNPPATMGCTLAAIRHLERATLSIDWADGVVLRYGAFYGPGTGISLAGGASLAGAVRRRLLPLVGGGTGVWSFVHIEDAASATVLAAERGDSGIYNVVDDEPAPVHEWLPALAKALGANPPLWIPRWLARVVFGEAATVLMTESRGASNAKAKRVLDWRPRYETWRLGFETGLGMDTHPARSGSTLLRRVIRHG